MKTIVDFYKLIEKDNILLKYIPNLCKEYNVLGLYINVKGQNLILMDCSLFSNYKEHLDVISEEYGHYLFSVGNHIEDIDSNFKKMNVQKDEYKIKKWKCKTLITEEELKSYLYYCSNISEVAESLNVTEEILLLRLKKLAKENFTYEIKDNIAVDLTKLPNLHKIDPKTGETIF